jgi:hypothetical protein
MQQPTKSSTVFLSTLKSYSKSAAGVQKSRNLMMFRPRGRNIQGCSLYRKTNLDTKTEDGAVILVILLAL